MCKGAEALSDAELLAVLLRTGSPGKNAVELAQTLLRDHDGSLAKVFGLSLSQISQTSGIGPSKAVQFKACIELAKRLLASAAPITDLQSALETIQAQTAFAQKEMLYAIYLDARGRVLKTELIATGTVNASAFHPREVFKTAFAENAASIVLAHNHPSGNVEASEADVELTVEFQKLCAGLGLEMLGHYVVTTDAIAKNEPLGLQIQ